MITIRRATEADCDSIVRYLEAEAIDNTYMLGDIHIYGFDSEALDVWAAEDANEIIYGVILRYYTAYLCYTKLEDGVIAKMQAFLLRQNPHIIVAKGSVADALMPGLEGYMRSDKILCALFSTHKLKDATTQIIIAKPEDAPEIARQFSKIDEIKEYYDEVSLADNIATRIRSGEGEHLFIRLDGKIVAHGNSSGFAEKTTTAGVNGIFTLPEYRGCGYASQIVSEISRRIYDSGKTPVIAYDNPDAGQIYRRLGYEDVGVLTAILPPDVHGRQKK